MPPPQLQKMASELNARNVRNLELKAQLDALKRELEGVRKKAAVARPPKTRGTTELQRIDQAIARLRKQNREMQLQIELHATQTDNLKQLRSQADDLAHRLQEREKENAVLQRLLARQEQGVAEQGPTKVQETEMRRLKSLAASLQRELREAQQIAIEQGRRQQQEQLEWSRLCTRRERLKRSLEDPESDQQRSRVTPALGAAGAAAKEAEHELQLARKERQSQKRRFQVRMHDLHNEIKELQQQLDESAGQLADKERLLGLPFTDVASLKPPVSPVGSPSPSRGPPSPSKGSPNPKNGKVSPLKGRASPPRGSPPPGRSRSPTQPRERPTGYASAPSTEPGGEHGGDQARHKAAVLVQAVSRGKRDRRLYAARRAEAAAAEAASAGVQRSALNPFGGKKKKGLFGGGGGSSLVGGGLNGGPAKPPLGLGAAASKPTSLEPPVSWRMQAATATPTGLSPSAAKPNLCAPFGRSAVSAAGQGQSPQSLPCAGVLSAAPQSAHALSAAAAGPPPAAPATEAATRSEGRRGRGRRMLDLDDEDTPAQGYVPSFASEARSQPVDPSGTFDEGSPSPASRPAPAEEPPARDQSISGVIAAARQETTSLAAPIGMGKPGVGRPLPGRRLGPGMNGPTLQSDSLAAGLGASAPRSDAFSLGRPALKAIGSSGSDVKREGVAAEAALPGECGSAFCSSALGSQSRLAEAPASGIGAGLLPHEQSRARCTASNPPWGPATSMSSIPTLGDDLKSRGVGGGLRLADLKPPTFDDEIDDEALAAEEQAFLQRMKEKKEQPAAVAQQPDALPSVPTGSSLPAPNSASTPAATGESKDPLPEQPSGKYADGYSAPDERANPGSYRGPVGLPHDGLDDDLSEEEID